MSQDLFGRIVEFTGNVQHEYELFHWDKDLTVGAKYIVGKYVDKHANLLVVIDDVGDEVSIFNHNEINDNAGFKVNNRTKYFKLIEEEK